MNPQDLLEKWCDKKGDLSRELQNQNHTLIVDVHSQQNVLSINFTRIARSTGKAIFAIGIILHNDKQKKRTKTSNDEYSVKGIISNTGDDEEQKPLMRMLDDSSALGTR